VGDKFLRDLKSNSVTFSARVLVSMLALAEFLVSEARIIERGGSKPREKLRTKYRLSASKTHLPWQES